MVLLTLFVGVLLQVAPRAQIVSRPEPIGRLSGVVLDLQGARVTEASIVLDGKGIRREIVSDEAGNFLLEVPAGVYRLTVKGHCFKLHQRKALRVVAGKSRELKVVLESATCGGGYLKEK